MVTVPPPQNDDTFRRRLKNRLVRLTLITIIAGASAAGLGFAAGDASTAVWMVTVTIASVLIGFGLWLRSEQKQRS
jgi:general stress protein CsbA